MAIGTCDNCDRQNVPVTHYEGTYVGDTTQCFLCTGDTDPDPYCELEEQLVVILAEDEKPSQVGQAMHDADAALNHLVELRNDPDTREQMAGEEAELWRLKNSLEWILSSILLERAVERRQAAE